MIDLVFDFTSLTLAALMVGAMFAVCLLFNPTGVDPATYVMHQQWGVHALHPKLPLLGSVTTLAILVAAFLSRNDRAQMTLMFLAAALFIAAGLITRLLNMPINAVVMTWSPQSPPADWFHLRDVWWRWHLLRFGAGAGGLCLLIVAALRQRACL